MNTTLLLLDAMHWSVRYAIALLVATMGMVILTLAGASDFFVGWCAATLWFITLNYISELRNQNLS